ncbi:SixA phosphatase family protein [Hirschia litorea]|uniref:SixA phosphatase family protein n=1 Tax=Hirschia litorea TaxID=1199156 RepID=A0ABW2ILW3_9PROT
MIELILFRHAKTHPAMHGEADHERRLTQRGWDDARLIAQSLYGIGARPDLIIHSDALRCSETLDAIAPTFSNPPSISSPELYLAESQTILPHTNLKAQTSDCKSVLVIGHNPGMQLLASSLAPGSTENEVRIRMGFPTSAAAVFRRTTPEHQWELHTFVTPKELKQATKKKLGKKHK